MSPGFACPHCGVGDCSGNCNASALSAENAKLRAAIAEILRTEPSRSHLPLYFEGALDAAARLIGWDAEEGR